MTMLLTVTALVAVAIWIYLIIAHGEFWLSRPELAPVARVSGRARRHRGACAR